ncbi:hypothetical protein [Sutcliffiella rhizosphaerae]|uniref:Uncharacterized protein n=1 Tax=Sutcliffiella rhizosphaerae TaxID=2880967 RepID=A0ABN8ADX7_9BACI|nr:hypothetical protein [Sutcliffiella rhizosphaerae]CAG9620980.1 hypothetical protein BACCIP111883_01752 [Sutcliffiella rhizosphaerae]
MVKRKATVALSIFSTLFVGAWWLNTEHKKDYMEHYQHEDSSILLIESNQQTRINVVQPFEPREYIRIVATKKDKEEMDPTQIGN